MLNENEHGSRGPSGDGGFTLIELLVVVVIIGILVTLSVPYLTDARTRARETQTAANLSEIHKALEQFGTDNNSTYPFRIRWFANQTVNAPGFDPYRATDTGAGMTSDPPNWCSLGLIGGAHNVDDNFVPTLGNPALVEPHGFDVITNNFYRIFNQYSDPLRALGYVSDYPQNPFLKRPMGSIAWTYGNLNWNGGPDLLNKTLPGPDVYPLPGDFVYTFFYNTRGVVLIDPPGILEAKKSYQAKSPLRTNDGMYYLDVIDSYQLWAYGALPLNGAAYVCYPNNSLRLSSRSNQEPKKDFDNSGTKDMFELGMIAYFKRAGGQAGGVTNQSGGKIEF